MNRAQMTAEMRELCGSTQEGALSERAVYLGAFAAMHRANMLPTGKTVCVVGEGILADVLEKLAVELGAMAVYRHGRAKYDPNGIGLLFLADGAGVSLKSYPTLEGVLDLSCDEVRTRAVFDAEERDLNCATGVYALAAAVLVDYALTRGENVSEDAPDRLARAYYESKLNILFVGPDGEEKEKVAAALARLSGREVLRIGRDGADKVGGLFGKVLSCDETIPNEAKNAYLLARNCRVLFLTPPVSEVTGDAGKASPYALRARDMLSVCRDFCDTTCEYRGDPEATAKEILSAFRKQPYVKRG